MGYRPFPLVTFHQTIWSSYISRPHLFAGRTETMKEDGRSLLRLLKAPPGPWDDQFPVTNIQDKHKPPNYYSEYYKPFNSSIIKELQRFFRLDCVLNGYPISPFEPEYIDYKL